jgi:hypothetical protein
MLLANDIRTNIDGGKYFFGSGKWSIFRPVVLGGD